MGTCNEWTKKVHTNLNWEQNVHVFDVKEWQGYGLIATSFLDEIDTASQVSSRKMNESLNFSK